MRAVLQRVSSASVRVRADDGAGTTEHLEGIDTGLLSLLCVEEGDTEDVIDWAADKTARMRIFNDDAGKMNRSVVDVGGGVLVVSQFTLAGDTSRGNRPSFITAAQPELASPLVDRYAKRLEHEHGLTVARGVFGASMEVSLVNHGPVTVILERRADEQTA
jgi:D-tyrosyl-tRNA(Tyr) deacylase